MGTFFLFAGTTLFLAGLGCLLSVFVSTLARLKAHRATSIYFRKTSSFRKWIPAIIGIFLVVMAQGFYWFHDEVSRFTAFEDTIPQMNLDFVVEQDMAPRVELTHSDRHHQLNSQMVPLKGDLVFVSSEVILWSKPMKALGLDDCYHFDGIYYDEADSLYVYDRRDPDYELLGGPSGLVSLIRLLGPVFPAEAKIVISSPVPVDPETKYSLRLSSETFSLVDQFDKLQAADYSL